MRGVQQNAKTKNLSLELTIAPENIDATGSADFNKIRQVFLNVIDNAIKYTNEGYGKWCQVPFSFLKYFAKLPAWVE